MCGSCEGSLNAHKLNVVDSAGSRKVAKEGNSVIVGRGSQHFLRNTQYTLRVFLYAPKDGRLRRLLTRGKTATEAEQLVDSVDQERADYTMINIAFGIRPWQKRLLLSNPCTSRYKKLFPSL